jgi:hypothetical protein
MLNCETPAELFEELPPLTLVGDGSDLGELDAEDGDLNFPWAPAPTRALPPTRWWTSLYRAEVRERIESECEFIQEASATSSPRGKKKGQNLLRIKVGKHALLQFTAFVAFVTLSANDTIVKAVSKTRVDGDDQPRDFPYAFSSVLVVASAISVTVGSMWGLAVEGIAGLQRCWDPRSLLRMTPISMLFQFATMLKFVSLKSLPPDIVSVISQMQLVSLAVALRCVLGKHYRPSQWITLTLTFLAMVQYIRDRRHKSHASPLQLSPNVVEGLLVLAVMVVIETLAAVLAERTFKERERLSVPFWAQKVHIDSSALLFAALWCYVLEPGPLKDLDWSCRPQRCRQVIENGLFDGWDSWTWVVLGLVVSKMWLSCWVVKVLDSVVKQLGSCVGVVLTYLEAVWLWPQENSLDFDTVIALAVVVMAVASFACSTRDQRKIEKRDIEITRLKKAASSNVDEWIANYAALAK